MFFEPFHIFNIWEGFSMEQTMSKNAKPLLMMKALVLAYAVTGILLLVLAFLLYKLGLGESQVNLGIMVIYILSSLLGGFYMGKKVKIRRFLWGMGLGVGYACLLTAVTFLTEHQMRGDMKEMALLFFLCTIGGALGGMLS